MALKAEAGFKRYCCETNEVVHTSHFFMPYCTIVLLGPNDWKDSDRPEQNSQAAYTNRK